jgi:hypothetical protein
LNVIKFPDIVSIYTALFVHQYSNGKLPEAFNDFFSLIQNQHNYNTRLASRSTYSLPPARTNFGKFRIRFRVAQIWNEIDESTLKTLSKLTFKHKLKEQLIGAY